MTLIETIIALGISAVIIGSLGGVIYSVVEITGRGNAEIKALENLNRASYRIRTDAREAVDYVINETADNITFFKNESGTVAYYLADTRLLRKEDGNVTEVAACISSIEYAVENYTLKYSLAVAPPGKWDVNREMMEKVYLLNVVTD